jgi:hypothetical protein
MDMLNKKGGRKALSHEATVLQSLNAGLVSILLVGAFLPETDYRLYSIRQE